MLGTKGAVGSRAAGGISGPRYYLDSPKWNSDNDMQYLHVICPASEDSVSGLLPRRDINSGGIQMTSGSKGKACSESTTVLVGGVCH